MLKYTGDVWFKLINKFYNIIFVRSTRFFWTAFSVALSTNIYIIIYNFQFQIYNRTFFMPRRCWRNYQDVTSCLSYCHKIYKSIPNLK